MRSSDDNDSGYESEEGNQSSEPTETGGSSSLDGSRQQQGLVTDLVGNETKQVFCSRLAFLCIFFVATAATATAVFLVSKNDEKRSFETRFNDFANQIVEVSQMNANDIFGVFERMSLHMTIYAEARGETWPYVIIPSIEAQGQQAMIATGASSVAVTTIVTDKNKAAYEEFMVKNQGWMAEELEYAGAKDITPSLIPKIWTFGPNRSVASPENQAIYVPTTTAAPIETLHKFVNFDAFTLPYFNRVFQEMNRTKQATISEVRNLDEEYEDQTGWPRSFMAAPIFDTIQHNKTIVGQLTAQMPWHSYFLNLVPDDIDDIYMVVRNTCNQSFTYLIDGPEVDYLGPGDHHDTTYDYLEVPASFTAFRSLEECVYSLHLYPSDSFFKTYATVQPIINTVVVACVFFLTAVFFLIYDQLVEKRQSKVLTTATKSHAIVSSLFPDNVRDRLMEDNEDANDKSGKRLDAFHMGHAKGDHRRNARAMMPMNGAYDKKSSPIAEYFASATVLFADIVGFTAWSSTREPVEVFTLLEAVYNAFDKIAVRMHIFKVETIGDCYVAACGLPEPRDDHAVIMFRFCRYCLGKMNSIVHKLADTLGPDTSELCMRFGCHSGPVTAGVLRGEKSRFQLFGDTVNTAARIEGSGAPNRIHLSAETANELSRYGKANWFRPREDAAELKGKGRMKTYWGVLRGEASTESPTPDRNSDSVSDVTEGADPHGEMNAHGQHLEHHIAWNVSVLEQLLKDLIIARRGRTGHKIQNLEIKRPMGATAIDEVKEVIPFYSKKVSAGGDTSATVELSSDTMNQLEDFVRTIAGLYRGNPFHSFAHASHVVQALRILFSRVSDEDTDNSNPVVVDGIGKDPMLQFAAVFSAMVHDVDHLGVSNAVLVEQRHTVAKLYDNTSVAEQHSVDLAWNLLMEPRFMTLRSCIYTNQHELERFRQLVVHAVLATDIMDKDLNGRRKTRWERAFADTDQQQSVKISRHDQHDLQATVVYEHFLQASDVAHTMQHWHTYIKWNERLFQEMYKAHQDGHISNDPSRDWYEGELGFFDYYIIPLARKLKECGVLGVSSDEFLVHAEANRTEWEVRGKSMLTGYLKKYGDTKREIDAAKTECLNNLTASLHSPQEFDDTNKNTVANHSA